ALHVARDDDPARTRNPCPRTMDKPSRHFPGVNRRIRFTNGLEQCFAPLELRTQRTDAPFQPGSQIGTTNTAPGGVGKGRLGGDRCHRWKGAGALSPSKLAKYTMKPLRLRRVMAYDERLQHPAEELNHDDARLDAAPQELAQVEPWSGRAGVHRAVFPEL